MKDKAIFTEKHLSELKAAFSTINTVDPRHLDRFHKMFETLNDDALIQIIKAEIKFVSKIARNAAISRGFCAV
jgi:hypothetical protein